MPLLVCAEAYCPETVATVVAVQGTLISSDKTTIELKPGDPICAGTTLKTGALGRSVLAHSTGGYLTLRSRTEMDFPAQGDNSAILVKLRAGTVYFLDRVEEFINASTRAARRYRRHFQVETEFITIGVEGTEFIVDTNTGGSRVWVLDGRVKMENLLGTLRLNRGEAGSVQPGEAPRPELRITPEDAVQWTLYYPPIIDLHTGAADDSSSNPIAFALAPYRQGRVDIALKLMLALPQKYHDAAYFNQLAALLLVGGDIKAARRHIERSLQHNPNNGDALALRAIIALARNRKEVALDSARAAVRNAPESATAHTALSYVLQAWFRLEEALTEAQAALALDPGNALAQVRIAELLLSLGRIDTATEMAEKAAALDSGLARVQTILGFSHLLQQAPALARQAFTIAITKSPSDPLPHFGLGLVSVQMLEPDKARYELEASVALDPGNSVLRSYLGKLYIELDLQQQAQEQFELAIQFDPNDPTPWLYAAILSRRENRPLTAVDELERSIARNESRAVFRSRSALDSDLAIRSTDLGEALAIVGFEQRAQTLGWQATLLDPFDYSAHLLLAHGHEGDNRNEIARNSEYLKAQLLRPAAAPPLPPASFMAARNQTENSNFKAGFMEFGPLFNQPGISTGVTVAAGTQGARLGQLLLRGNSRHSSVSADLTQFDSKGYRDNSDLDISNGGVLITHAIDRNWTLQGEFARNEYHYGDLTAERRGTPADDIRSSLTRDLIRAAIINKPSENIMVMLQGTFHATTILADNPDPGLAPDKKTTENGTTFEAATILHHSDTTLELGVRHFQEDILNRNILQAVLLSPQHTQASHDSGYFYWIQSWPFASVIAGASTDRYRLGQTAVDKRNSKLGINIKITPALEFNAIFAETVKPNLITNSTLERTALFGMPQYHDDSNGSQARNQGLAMDWSLSGKVTLGARMLDRNITSLLHCSPTLTVDVVEAERQFFSYAYFHHQKLGALTIDWQSSERKTLEGHCPLSFAGAAERRREVTTLRYSRELGSGLFASLTGRHVTSQRSSSQDSFNTLDAALSYQTGPWTFAAKAKNILDEDFDYFDEQRAADLRLPRFLPTRSLLFEMSYRPH